MAAESLWRSGSFGRRPEGVDKLLVIIAKYPDRRPLVDESSHTLGLCFGGLAKTWYGK